MGFESRVSQRASEGRLKRVRHFSQTQKAKPAKIQGRPCMPNSWNHALRCLLRSGFGHASKDRDADGRHGFAEGELGVLFQHVCLILPRALPHYWLSRSIAQGTLMQSRPVCCCRETRDCGWILSCWQPCKRLAGLHGAYLLSEGPVRS